MTRRPRSAALRAKSAVASGVRWAERTWDSLAMPRLSRVSTQWRMVSQSEALPMMTATSEDFWSGMNVISLEARISQAGSHSASRGAGSALLLAMEGRGRAIVLIGFMGTGKSSAGQILERRTGWPRFDTDEMIAARFGRPI